MIDWDRINELREEIGEEDFNEVLEIFLEEVEETLESLALAGEAENLREPMHFLKGSAMNLGFSDLAAFCQKCEMLANEGRSTEIDRHAVAAVYDKTKTHFAMQNRGFAA